MLLFSHKSVLIFGKIKFTESKCFQCYLYHIYGCRLQFINDVFKCMIMCWCRHHWDWQCPGILIRDLICKFQLTFVVTTDFLCREIYISIFIYQFLIIWICYYILHENFTGFNSARDMWFMFFDTFLWLSLQKGHFFKKKNPVADLFTTVSFISLCRIWLHFGSYSVGSGCAV